jgi:lysophospholipase L1-like esterase
MAEARPYNRFDRHPRITLLGLLAAALLVLELGLRAAGPLPVRFARDMRRLHRYSRTSRVELVPDTSVRLRIDRRDGSPFLDFTVTTGRDGFRVAGRPGTGGAVRGTPCLHAVGDSYTMGWGVDDAAAYPAQLESLLAPGTPVVNLGVDGYGTLGATGQSMALAERYPPVHAVYLFVPNDFEDDERALAVSRRTPAVHLANEALDAVRRHSALAAVPFALRYLLQFRAGTAGPAGPAAAVTGLDPERLVLPAPASLPAPDPSRPSLARLAEYRRFLEARGAGLTVLVLSTRPESLETLRYCRENGIRALLIEVPPPMRLPDEGHFNALGNRAVAQLVARRLGPGARPQ